MSHYFTNDTSLKHNRREISFRFLGLDYTMVSDDGVFSKDALDEGTKTLLEVVSQMGLKGHVGDLGSGIGVVGVILHRIFGVKMSGFDVNQRAIDLANENYKRYKVDGNNFLQDGISGHFDAIISNPPIRVGKEILYRLFDEVYQSLNDEGVFVFVIRKSHGAKSAQAKCKALFGNCELLKKNKGYYIYKSYKIDAGPKL